MAEEDKVAIVASVAAGEEAPVSSPVPLDALKAAAVPVQAPVEASMAAAVPVQAPVPATDGAAEEEPPAGEEAPAGHKQITHFLGTYDPDKYIAPLNPYDTGIDDLWSEVTRVCSPPLVLLPFVRNNGLIYLKFSWYCHV